ncbi:MAG: hypothetical protein R3E10_06235 [Gemmatimonadota bacterium]
MPDSDSTAAAGFASAEEVARIGKGLLAADLPRAQWTHAAHWAAALWLLRERPELDAARVLPALIRRYNESSGTANTDSSGYHETITRASLRAAAHWIAAAAPDEPLHRICNRLVASPLGSPDWLLRYWSRPVLFSVEARRGWVEPDLAPLPY